MAKRTEPKGRLVRRFGENIFGNPKYDRLLERRSDPPGQHGGKGMRRKVSNYGRQLLEKQKLKETYGLLEKQFRRTFQHALRQKGVTGDNLLTLLESRLDNAVYRAGLAVSRMQARQLVNHGHFSVNGRKTDIPSCLLRVGDQVSVRERETSRKLVTRCQGEVRRLSGCSWLEESGELSFRVRGLPQRGEIDTVANEQLVVELYSR